MHWMPGARMATPGARAQGAVARDILWPVRARARVSRSKFHKIRAPQCHSAVKMGGRTVYPVNMDTISPVLIEVEGMILACTMTPSTQYDFGMHYAQSLSSLNSA